MYEIIDIRGGGWTGNIHTHSKLVKASDTVACIGHPVVIVK